MRSPCFLLGQHFQGDYFFFHHTAGDNMIVLDSDQMDRASAVVAVCLSLSLCLSVCLCLTHTPAGAGTYFRTQALYNAKTKLYVLWANAVGCLKATCPNATCAAYAMVRFQCSVQCG